MSATGSAPDHSAARRRRASEMIQRAAGPLWIGVCLVGAIVIAVPLALGLPSLAAAGVLVLLCLAACLHAVQRGDELFRRAAHLVYLVALLAVAYAVFGLGLAPVITVYFPALVLLGAAHILGARAAIFWSVPSLVLVALAVAFPQPENTVSPLITFVVRAATLVTILGFAVTFRRSHDRQAEELRLHATTDALTGLANRREFDRALSEALDRARRFDRRGAIVYIDLDGVKRVNDESGHASGDDLIRTVANRISDNTRAVDTAARIGGDEFVVLLSEVDPTGGGETAARNLLDSLCQPAEIGGRSITPSASIGVTHFPESGRSAADLLRIADDAMYRAKRAGGRRVVVGEGASPDEAEASSAQEH